MSEQKLQSDIVRKFSELYPEKRGQLFHVSNERNHQKQALMAQSIGIVPGVSDLIYVEGLTSDTKLNLLNIISKFVEDKSSQLEMFSVLCKELNLGKLKLLELKAPGTRHKVEHIESQIAWGKTMRSIGNDWRLIRSTKEAIHFIEYMGFDEGLTIEDVENILLENKNNKNNKTIKF